LKPHPPPQTCCVSHSLFSRPPCTSGGMPLRSLSARLQCSRALTPSLRTAPAPASLIPPDGAGDAFTCTARSPAHFHSPRGGPGSPSGFLEQAQDRALLGLACPQPKGPLGLWALWGAPMAPLALPHTQKDRDQTAISEGLAGLQNVGKSGCQSLLKCEASGCPCSRL